MKFPTYFKVNHLISLFIVVILISCDPRAFKVPTPSMEATIPVGSRVVILDGTPKRNDIVIFKPPSDPETYYIFRMVAVPGDTIKILKSKLFIDGVEVKDPETVRHKYKIITDMSLRDRFFEENGINDYYPQNDGFLINIMKHDSAKLMSYKFIKSVERMEPEETMINPTIYPDFRDGNPDFINEIYLPKKGDKIIGENLKKYVQTISDCEGVNIESLDEYVFKNSYCFMMGDNRDNALDSRFIGLIPTQNVVGRGTVWYRPD